MKLADTTSPAAAMLTESALFQRFKWLGYAVLLSLLVMFALWSFLAPLSSAVVAAGVVKAEGNRKTIQHLEGGIIKKLLVKDGDYVKANQVLIELSDERVNAGLDQLLTQLDSEKAKESRLRAESDMSLSVQWLPTSSSNSKTASTTKLADFINKEKDIFRTKRQSLDKQVALLQQQAVQVDSEIRSLRAQIAAITQSLGHAESELKVTRDLADQGFLQKTRVMNLERDVSMQVASIESARAEESKAQQRKIDLQLKAELTRQEYSRSASESLKETVARRLELEERIRPLADASTRQNVLAPVSGFVVDSRYFASGAVIGPRDPILDIIPDQTGLIVEAKVRAQDSVRIAMNQSATLLLQTTQQRDTVKLYGNVTYISADQTTDRQTGVSTFTVNLAVTPESLQQIDGLKLTSGMPVEVFISSGSRNLLQYLFEPLSAGFRRGMRER